MGESSDHTIVVAGHAERRVDADRARWSITVDIANESESAAFRAADIETSRLIEELRSTLDEDAEIATSRVSVTPNYSSERQRYVGYRATMTISVESAVEAMADVASIAISGPHRRLNGPQVFLANPEPVRDELLVEAMEGARHKTTVLASAAGRHVRRILWVRDQGADADGHDNRSLVLHEYALDASSGSGIEPERPKIAVDLVVAFELSD